MARVLVIEEEESLGELIRLYCQDEGHDAARVGTMADALEILETEKFDLALLALEPRAPVVLDTGHRLDPQRLRALGYAGFIQKPFDIDDFNRVFQQVLARGDACHL